MPQLLTEGQIRLLQWLPHSGASVELYEDDSVNGLSWTLRYRRSWAEPGNPYPRRESHMVFAVRKPVDAKDDAAVYSEKMKPRVEEARRVFMEAVRTKK
jgi:hypothetical protein